MSGDEVNLLPMYGGLRKFLFFFFSNFLVASNPAVYLAEYDIVSDPTAIRYVAEFMHHTGLLHQFRYVGYQRPWRYGTDVRCGSSYCHLWVFLACCLANRRFHSY